jgi:hypothetical protein
MRHEGRTSLRTVKSHDKHKQYSVPLRRGHTDESTWSDDAQRDGTCKWDAWLGRAMAQVVSRWPLTAEARVRARVYPCGICGGQSGTGTVFSPSSSVFPCQYHSTVALQTHYHLGNA